MSDLDKRIHNAYESVLMPVGLKEKTLTYISEREKSEQLANQKVSNDVPQNTLQNKRQSAPQTALETVQPATQQTTHQSTSEGSEAAQRGTQDQRGQSIQPRGEVVVMRRKRPARALVAAMAACLVLAVAGFGGFKVYTTETAFVGIELNPSLELGLNYFNIVVSTEAYNDDAQEILDEISLTGKSYDEAMATLAQSTYFAEYLDENAFLDINIACDNQRQTQTLQTQSESYIASLPCAGACRNTSTELRAQAQSHHMGTARYEAALVLIELDPSVTLEECALMTMRELRDRIAAAGGTVEEELLGGHHGQGQGNHRQGSQGQGLGQSQSQ